VPAGTLCPCIGSESKRNGCAFAKGNPRKNMITGIIQTFFNYLET